MRSVPVEAMKRVVTPVAPGFPAGNEPHYRFLVGVLTGAQASELVACTEQECWDWEILFRLASDERILPLLHDRIVDFMPAGVITEALRDIRDAHAARNEVILEELAYVAHLANRVGIEPVVLKGGAYLLTGLYAAPSDRYLADLDVLVPEPLAPVLVAQLLRNGYERDELNPAGVDCHHETGLRRAGRPMVEVHRSLGMGRVRRLLPAAEVIRDSRMLPHGGAKLRVPSDEHLLAHHAIHAQLNHTYRQAIWPSLREAYDCRLLTARLAASGWRPGACGPVEFAERTAVIGMQLRTIQEMTGEFISLPPLGGLSAARLQWLHRRLLRAVPRLRFFDPYFFLRSSVIHRLQRLRDLGGTGRGLLYILSTPFRRSFYRNLFGELF